MFASVGVAFLLASCAIGLSAGYIAFERRRVLLEVDQVVRERTILLRAAAHQLRQPLSTVVGLASANSNDELLVTSAKELDSAVNDVFDVVQPSERGSKIGCGALDVRAEVLVLVRKKNKELLEQGSTVTIRVRELPECWIEADPSKITKCLAALIDQACYQTANDQVIISLKVEPLLGRGRHLTFTIHDGGPGLEPSLGRTYFDPLGYAKNPHLRGRPSAMLAISIARQVAESLGGTVEATTSLDTGTVFELSFEAAACSPAGVSMESVIPIVAPKRLPRLDTFSVLLVDDHVLNLFILEELVMPLGFGHVVSVSSGLEAIERAAEEAFDLILLDMVMPDIDGVEVTRQLRRGGASAHAQVIAISADHQLKDDIDFADVGIQGFVPKPIERSDFLSCLTKVAPAMQQNTDPTGQSEPLRTAQSG